MGWVMYNEGGFQKTWSRYAPGGANHNAFIVVISPLGAYLGGRGLMKTFHRYFFQLMFHLYVGFVKILFTYLIRLVMYFVLCSSMVLINQGQKLVYTHASFYSDSILFNYSKYMYHV